MTRDVIRLGSPYGSKYTWTLVGKCYDFSWEVFGPKFRYGVLFGHWRVANISL